MPFRFSFSTHCSPIKFSGNPPMQAARTRRKPQGSRRPGQGHLGHPRPHRCKMGLHVPCSLCAGWCHCPCNRQTGRRAQGCTGVCRPHPPKVPSEPVGRSEMRSATKLPQGNTRYANITGRRAPNKRCHKCSIATPTLCTGT